MLNFVSLFLVHYGNVPPTLSELHYPSIEKPRKTDGEVIQSIQERFTGGRVKGTPQVSKAVRQ